MHTNYTAFFRFYFLVHCLERKLIKCIRQLNERKPHFVRKNKKGFFQRYFSIDKVKTKKKIKKYVSFYQFFYDALRL